MLKQYRLKNYHFQLVIYIIALSIIGILLIGSAKHSVQSKQIIGFIMGLIIMIALSLIDYSFLLKFVWIYYACMIALLLLHVPVSKIPGTTPCTFVDALRLLHVRLSPYKSKKKDTPL